MSAPLSAPPVTSGAGAPPVAVPREAWLVFVAIAVGTFMSALDSSVVNIVLPMMRTSLHASVATIEWVVIIYLLVVSGTLLVFGRIGDMRGYKKIYLLGFALFVTGSLACGLARTEVLLIAFRGFQALGAAMLFASSPAILTTVFPPQRRGRVLGLQGTLTYLGLSVGAPLGGMLAAKFGWPVIFYINVPVCLIAAWLAWRFIPTDVDTESTARFDGAGALTFLVGLVSLTTALDQGSTWGWSSTPILGLFALAAVMLVAFVLIERRHSDPMLDLSLFGNRTFTVSTLVALLNYVAIYTVVFLTPFYLQQGRGLSIVVAGSMISAQFILMAVMAPVSGGLSDRFGTRAFVIGGMALLTVGLVTLGLLGPDTPLWIVTGALMTVGLGTGIFVSPNTSALMGAAPLHRRGIASGILAEGRNVGMVLGVGLAGAVFTTGLAGAQPGANAATFQALTASFFAAAGVAALGVVVAVLAPRTGRAAR